MDNPCELAKLFFELASDSRLGILYALQSESLKLQDVARQLDVTATEAFRQLERLGAALLVARQPEGTYTITSYGRIVLQLSVSLKVVLRHQKYFATHDLLALPYQFVNRLSELEEASLINDTMESLNKGQRLFIEMQQFGWGMAEGVVPELMGPIMDQQLLKGIKMRFMVPVSKLPPNPPHVTNVETRALTDIPVVIAVSEKSALVCLRSNDGKMDYSGFYGSDPAFLGWAKDLFLSYWEQGKRV